MFVKYWPLDAAVSVLKDAYFSVAQHLSVTFHINNVIFVLFHWFSCHLSNLGSTKRKALYKANARSYIYTKGFIGARKPGYTHTVPNRIRVSGAVVCNLCSQFKQGPHLSANQQPQAVRPSISLHHPQQDWCSGPAHKYCRMWGSVHS